MSGLFDTITGFVGDEYTAAKGFVGKEYDQVVGYGSAKYHELKTNTQNWAKEVVKLMNLKVPPQFADQKNSLLSKARVIKAGAEKIFGKLDNINQLGFIPVVAGLTIGAVALASAGMTYWITGARALAAQVAVYNASLEHGSTPQQAADIASKVADTGGLMSSVKDVTSSLKQYAPLIGVVVIAVVFRKQIASMIKGRK